MTLCVYALVRPVPVRLGSKGVAGERLRPITVNGITAIVGELRRTPGPTMKNLRRHAAVIEAIADRAPAILPARFGTCVADRGELAMILRSRQSTFRRRLSLVRGRAQMTLRLVESESGDASYPTRSAKPGRARLGVEHGATQGTQYLKARAAIAASARAIRGFEPIRGAVRRLLKDERIEKRAGVVTVNHLIPRASAATYRVAVERAARRSAIRLIVSGPWPPFAFADNW